MAMERRWEGEPEICILDIPLAYLLRYTSIIWSNFTIVAMFRINMTFQMKMRVNSNALIETPEKSLSEKSPKISGRKSPPSKHLDNLLESVKRQHIFHNNTTPHIPLENMKLTLQIRNKIRKLFEYNEKVVSEKLVEFEMFDLEKQNTSCLVIDFISYEFQVIKQHSSSVVVFLNYLKMFDLEPEKGFNELFNFSVHDTVCAECHSEKGYANVKDINLAFLRGVIGNEYNCSDSDRDPDYEEKILDCEEESSEEESEVYIEGEANNLKTHVVKKLDYEENSEEEESPSSSNIPTSSTAEVLFTNPFVNDDDEEMKDVYSFSDVPNGTNPFASSEEDEDDENQKYVGSKLGPRTSSIKPPYQHVCDHCQKAFQNKYNLKLHLISQHRQGSQLFNFFL